MARDIVISPVLLTLQTSATGSQFVAFAPESCSEMEIKNTRQGAVDLEVRRGSSGATVCVPAGAADTFAGLNKASDIQVRHYAQSNVISFDAESMS